MVTKAVQSIEGYTSISAKFRQRADLFGHQMVGSGTYLQWGQGPDCLLRMELKLRVGDEVSSLLQVCDGKTFWIYQELLDETTLARVDVGRVARVLEKARTTPGVQPPSSSLGVGGLESLLRGLDASFHFPAVRAAKLDNVPVWVVRGEWEKSRLVTLLPDQKKAIESGQPADLSKLPAHLPDQVVLFLGQEDFIPYRIEYRRTDRGAAQPSAGAGEGSRVLVVMELVEVKLNGRIDRQQFVYNPGTRDAIDQTDRYLAKLGLPAE
ncbi:MAG: LolA-like protein [Pirellulales bacterium]